jgi:AcrR family transcriptional regulator
MIAGMDSSTIGLRERKRLETRARIERAAVSLVLQDGLDGTTIDRISQVADVSSRTFFNYFETKEDAVLGLHGTELDDDVVAAELAAADLGADRAMVRIVIHLLVTAMGPRLTEIDQQRERKVIVERHPQLASRLFAHMNRLTTTITAAVRSVSDDAAPDDAWPDVTVALCGAAVRASVTDWAAARSGSLADLEERALALVTHTMEHLR